MLNSNQIVNLRMCLSLHNADDELTAIEVIIASTLAEYDIFPQTRSQLYVLLPRVPESCLSDIRNFWIQFGRCSIVEALQRSQSPLVHLLLGSYLERKYLLAQAQEGDRQFLERCLLKKCDRVS